MVSGSIVLVNAREHNLKNISISLPQGKLVVLTGPSGAGKSTLAFDVIFVESQRRYIESLSSYARQFLHMYNKPEVDDIHGLSPSIAIDQRGTFKSPRSTVATMTEIYDYIRLLFASVGLPYDSEGNPIRSYTRAQIIDMILSMPLGAKIHILTPMQIEKNISNNLAKILKAGFSRVRVDGVIHDAEDVANIIKTKVHSIEIVVDRITVEPSCRARVAEAIDVSLGINDSTVWLAVLEGDAYREILQLPTKLKLGEEMALMANLEPKMFSFNNPIGACKVCGGLGTKEFFDPALVISDSNFTLQQILENIDGEDNLHRISKALYAKLAAMNKIRPLSFDVPWRDLSAEMQHCLLYGDEKSAFMGLMVFIEYASENYYSLRRFLRLRACPECKGYRLNRSALSVRVAGRNIGEVTALSVVKMKNWLQSLGNDFDHTQFVVAEKITAELLRRLSFLEDVGLDYLTLDRGTATLSGGEGQRIKLASQIGSGLTNVLYVLDEPSIGLHKADTERLLRALLLLRDLGNSVLVVEHDDDVIRAADYVVDMGPCAGVNGGQVMASGTVAEIMANPKSITGICLSDKNFIPLPKERRVGNGKFIRLCGININNLKDLTVAFPLAKMICITGVSGSGKSTLVMEVLVGLLGHSINHFDKGKIREVYGLEYVDKIIEINQQSIGRTPRSNPATYTGVFDHIRQLMAATNEARMRGYKPNRFSFNVRGGRCDDCNGDGMKKIEMHFLPDVYVTCERCNGKKYNQETLAVLYRGKNISDILNMTIVEAMDFFSSIHFIHEKLEALNSVGLGYLRLGQASNTLSGGESQRIKLAKELSKRSTGNTLYILDEPTTGLHTCDIQNLLAMLNTLVDKGNTVLVIEHNMDVIKTADHVIDMGPLGGDRGGSVVAYGTPEEIAKSPNSLTGKFLLPHLE